MNESVSALQAVFAGHLPWQGARLNFLAQFLLALFKVRSVNLADLATGFGGMAQIASHYRRLQRCFRAFEIDYDVLARLLVPLFPVGEDPWYLTLDRTHWQSGKTEINFLVLGVAHQGMAWPVLWTVLDKAGNADTEERTALLQRLVKQVGRTRLKALLAARECVGGDWFARLHAQGLPFHLRLKRNPLLPTAWKVPMRADVLFGSL